MKMSRKRFDCERFENSHENVSGGVYFSNAANLQGTHNRFFSEDVPKCLKRTFWKSSWCNSVLIKYDPPVHSPQFYQNQR